MIEHIFLCAYFTSVDYNFPSYQLVMAVNMPEITKEAEGLLSRCVVYAGYPILNSEPTLTKGN